MKTLVVVLLMFSSAFAQRVQKLFPLENPTGKKWTTVAAGGSATFTFPLPGAGALGDGMENSYSGFCEVIVWGDTATTGGPGDRDSLSVSVYPMFFDMVSGVLEISAHAGKDSLDVLNDYDWGTTHSDDTYIHNVTVNVSPCDGIRVNVYCGDGAPIDIRPELRIAETKR